MQLGMIGLGRMGGNIVRRLMDHGHSCVVYDHAEAAVDGLVKAGATGASSLEDLVGKLTGPKIVWVMLPSGAITEETVTNLGGLLGEGDIVIDGGNSFWQDDIRRGKALAEKGVRYVDVGTSGGVWGRERGYCMMIGGTKQAVDHIDPILKTLAPGIGTIDKTGRPDGADPRPEQGYMHCGPVGSGHFVKMVHNGIEYGLMQAYAEGFDILKHAASEALPEEHRFDLNIGDVAEVWRRGSVVSSWLLDLSARALVADPELTKFTGQVEDSGEGRWTINAAINEAVPVDVLSAALFVRFRSREDHSFAEKLLSAMRFQFGGHVEKHGN
jgi:6-phosphogluconate dehydrogenase